MHLSPRLKRSTCQAPAAWLTCLMMGLLPLAGHAASEAERPQGRSLEPAHLAVLLLCALLFATAQLRRRRGDRGRVGYIGGGSSFSGKDADFGGSSGGAAGGW